MPTLTRARPKCWTKEDSDLVRRGEITLPYELWLLAARYLSPTDISNLLLVSHQLHCFSNEPTIWIDRYGFSVKTADYKPAKMIPNGDITMARGETELESSRALTLHQAWLRQFCDRYDKDSDLLFTGDGNDSWMGGGDGIRVDRVKRIDGCKAGRRYARKSVIIVNQEEGGPQAAERVFLQVKLLFCARHRHVVSVVEAYILESEHDIRLSIIMERADTYLDAYLKGKTSRKKTLRNLPRWFGYLIGVMAHVHGLGLQHGSMKPSNILVEGDRIVLADFGISRARLKDLLPATISSSGQKDYYVPEVEDGGTRGQPAEIFSLGAVFLEMIIAYAFPLGRRQLEDILHSQGTRSYARSLIRIQQFILELELSLQANEWWLKVLCYSRKMLLTAPDQRPMAEDLRLAWFSLQPSDLPLAPCTCHRPFTCRTTSLLS
ncbi:uncharacterized protein RAG0_07844 [Rhynchosporium agropyri]|uniref:Protein kinase domain-containing protein n=1 Tax=Rhynchosporium agropyri TaxID=914238 RepID=A0A1E1KN89_9HELO|nr:uncharacterized protein RAG0_07844 [Rhynchosporium agropyri]